VNTNGKRLAGRVAIVTGAAQGIGASYARALAAEGAAVMVADLLDGASVVRQIVASGGQAADIKVDVTDTASVQNMVAETVRRFGGLDILVNNAALFAVLPPKRFDEIDSTEWDKVMAVNVRGVFECTKAAAPEMRKKKYGKIVNIASGTVFKGSPMLLHYVTSKGAVVAMTRCLARELGDDGIRVNSLAPGLTLSEGVLANPAKLGARATSNVAGRAIKRDAVPDDMCGTMIYLCAAESDFVTGQVIVVDGGSVMH
jgi:NAD(P)-dependent dehydrogenase (short-subunit alcohol dehydrogenase family)